MYQRYSKVGLSSGALSTAGPVPFFGFRDLVRGEVLRKVEADGREILWKQLLSRAEAG